MQIKNIAEEGKTLLLSCAAVEVIVNPVAKYVFKVAPSDRHAVEMIYHQMKKMGITKIGVLSSNTGFGESGQGADREACTGARHPDPRERGL